MPQPIAKSQATAGFRRVPFVAVDRLALQTRISWAEMGIAGAGAFTIKISKNGAAPVTPSSTTLTETPGSVAAAKGSGYWEGAAADFDTPGFLTIYISSSGGTKVMEPREIHVEVNEVDAKNAIRGTAGTALPNVAAEAAGGLFTRGTGAGQINQASNGQIDTKVVAGDFIATLTRLQGLMNENCVIDEITWGDGNLSVLARKRVFANAAAASAATPGAGNGVDSEVARYTVSAVAGVDPGQFTSWKQVRAL